MDWYESRLDDSLFESMLSPILRQALEQIFTQEPQSRGMSTVYCGVIVFHQELGIVLQNDDSRKFLPKSSPGLLWEIFLQNFEDIIIPTNRSQFAEKINELTATVQGVWPIQPDRFYGANSLFFWGGKYNWGKIVFMRSGSNTECIQYQEFFKNKEIKIGNFLIPLIDRWILDATIEVFWSRILSNMPSEYKPSAQKTIGPKWQRVVSVPIQESVEKSLDIPLFGDYYFSPETGWSRSVRRPPPNQIKSSSLPLRAGPGEKGTTLEVPVDFWGFLPLGIVRFPSEIVRAIDIPNFLAKLRWARSIALRSLFLHLVIPGHLEFLNYWIPDLESFDGEILKEISLLTGDGSILDDALVLISPMSVGLRKSLEEKLRPGDLLLIDMKKTGQLWMLLKDCPTENVKKSVLPRLLGVEGMTEKNILGIHSLKEFLASQGMFPKTVDGNEK